MVKARWLVVAVITLSLDLVGDPLMRYQAQLQDLTPALEASTKAWRGLISGEFAAQAWRPPSGPFRNWQKVEAFGSRPAPARILHRSGALEAAMQGGAGGFTRITRNQAAFGLTGIMATIAATHRGGSGEVRVAEANQPEVIQVSDRMRGYLGANFGVHLRRDTTEVVIPRRPFATVNPELVTRVTAIFSAHVAGRPIPQGLLAA